MGTSHLPLAKNARDNSHPRIKESKQRGKVERPRGKRGRTLHAQLRKDLGKKQRGDNQNGVM